MESRKLLPAIVAVLMITTMLSMLSASTTAATHEPSVEITPKFVMQDISKVFTLKVTNTSGDSINRVKITIPSGFSGLASVVKVPKDNLLTCVDDTVVILPAGTVVKLAAASVNVMLYENTDVIRENNTWVWVPTLGENALLRDNAIVEVPANRNTSEGLQQNDNLAPTKDTSVTTITTDNTLRLLQDTLVVRVSGNVVRLPEDTLLEVTGDRTTQDNLRLNDNVVVKNDRRVKLVDNVVRLVQSVPVLRGGAVEATLGAGVSLQLLDSGGENYVIIPSGTKVKLLANVSVTIPENTDVKRASGKKMELVTPEAAENQPAGWTFDGTDTWSTDNAARMIAPGASLSFPFAVDVGHFGTPGSPVKADDYVEVVWAISTFDTKGARADKSYKTIVDYKWPTIYRIYVNDVYFDPKVKAGTTASVKISTSYYEVVTGMEENSVVITVGPADNIVENLKCTTTDNLDWFTSFVVKPEWEGKDVRIRVRENTLRDRAGNTGPWTAGGFASYRIYVDNTPPLKPRDLKFSGLDSLPSKDNQASWLVTGRCEDNAISGYTPDTLTAVVEVNGVAIRQTVQRGVSPYYTFAIPITLSEGPNTVKVWVEDYVGWKGEAVENKVFLDTKPPTVRVVSIAGKAFVENMAIKDNKPKIVVEMLDPGYAENKGLGVVFPENVSIKILRDDGSVVATLENSNVWDVATGIFENTLAEALPDNWYIINVSAGDNLNAPTVENFRFRVDTTPPPLPGAPTVTIPERSRVSSITVAGTAEPKATVKIVVKQDAEVKATHTTTADDQGNFSLRITLPEGTSSIWVSAIDEAGNEGPARLYGTIVVDSAVPTVTITSPPDKTTTSQASIAVVGKVSEQAKWTVIAPAGTWTGRTDKDGNFSVSIALVEGTNTIVVTAEDDAGNVSAPASIQVTRTVTAWGTYAIILVIIALILAAIAIFRRK